MDNPTVIAALVSGIVSIIVVILSLFLKSWIERTFLLYKLESEYQYEQKKKIKEVIGRNKTQLLDAGESLNHRLWNFADNYKRRWHNVKDFSTIPEQYYFSSFLYRMLLFFSWVHKVENEMIYLDTTIASPKDLDFLKFLRLLKQMMCDSILFKGTNYNNNYAKDHFFRNDFDQMCESLWNNKNEKEDIMSYSEFKENKNSVLSFSITMAKFLCDINPDEDRLRWDRLQAFHFVLLIFLNSYGYDFQFSDKSKIFSILKRSPRKNRFVDNIKLMISRIHLDEQKKFTNVLSWIQEYSDSNT